MPQARIYSPAGVYHTITRVNGKLFLLHPKAKSLFVRKLRQYAAFCGVDIFTYCILDNHIHILLREKESHPLSDTELLDKLAIIHDPVYVEEVRHDLKDARDAGDEEECARIRHRFLRRMFNVSNFMKELKQSFSIWFNRNHDRRGTLWEGRFRSVAVEDSENAILMMAAYIDLNPVRSGIVSDPKDYRFSGYGAAVGGDRAARRGINLIYAEPGKICVDAWREVSKTYRQLIFHTGREIRNDDGKIVRRGINAEEIEKTLRRGGDLSHAEVLRCRVRYFVDGAALGGEEFLASVLAQNRNKFGPKRKRVARPMRGGDFKGLFAIRCVALNVIDIPTARPGQSRSKDLQ